MFTESMFRTLFMCASVVAALFVAGYIINLEERVTALEEKVEHGLVIPLPLDLNRFRFSIIEGEPTQ